MAGPAVPQPLANDLTAKRQQVKDIEEKLSLLSFFYHALAGTQPGSPVLPSATLQIVFGLALIISYALLFLLARWAVVSSHFVSSYIIPVFTGLSRILVRVSVESGVSQHDAEDGGEVDARTLLVAMSLFYYLGVYVLSSVMSVMAQIGTSYYPYNNREPRLHKYSLPGGFAHRVVATHDALYDFFPAYTLAAVFTAWSLASSHSTTAVTVALPSLALHIAVKLGIWAPAYLLNIDAMRSTAHILANSALVLALLGLLGSS
ncbi:hypothetical protein BJ138DRAFT_1161773 [Hygrophoropsis aurantiaca]|uniref:Uncharacterized protein n=1 Tax=Hygrophoropsis aurantiaca TaxID=72124 RepID=A0ACB8A036_9AGAM|nr:hypothetical protein BJ138DRAFT_1161773 [Hygrophoropsis aurantiaca]